MSEIKAIETIYKGLKFRSRLEARWSVFFDAMGIKFLYEPEGFKLSDDTCYLPDFFLTDINQFFEVKGVLKLTDERKIERFVKEYRRPVVIGYDDFTFTACSNYFDTSASVEPYTRENRNNSVLMKCNKCGKYYFTGMNGSWKCSSCGYYDGDDTAQWISTGNLDTDIVVSEKYEKTKFKKAVERARQARFEYGERG